MSPQFIIESFWQKGANCAVVAVVKSLLLHYGMSGGLKIRKRGKYIVVKLPDGQVHSFTHKELSHINSTNKIGFRRSNERQKRMLNSIKLFTRICFAVLVRNMHAKGYEGKQFSEKAAIRTLTKKGVSTGWFHTLLGLSKKPPKPVLVSKLQSLKKHKAILLYNSKHIVAASEGYYDDFGKAVKIENEIPVLLDEKATHWYKLL